MPNQDRDIQDLERLLGHTKPAYRALRHKGALSERQPARGRTHIVAKLAVAACLALVVGALAWTALVPDAPSRQPAPFRMALPAPADRPLTLRPRPVKSIELAQTRAQLPTALRLPRRPVRTEG